MNTTHREIVERIMNLDNDASVVTADIRQAEKQLADLSKKTTASQDLILVSRKEMSFYEAEARRLYRRLDVIEERRLQKTERLNAAKNEDEHRVLKRDIDFAEREMRDGQRRVDELESHLEKHKTNYKNARLELELISKATEDERKKAQEARENSSDKLSEIDKVRESYLNSLDDHFRQHYLRVSKVTRNPQGPIAHVNSKACGNCFMELSPQILSHLSKKDGIEFCPSCYHILIL